MKKKLFSIVALIVTALLTAFGTTAGAVELEHHAEGKNGELINLQELRRAQLAKGQGNGAGAIELEFQAEGEPAQLMRLQMDRQAGHVKVKNVSNKAPLCIPNESDKANRCEEEGAQLPMQPRVSLWLRGLIGETALIQVDEEVCNSRKVVKGSTTGEAQFLLLPADCYAFNRIVRVQPGQPLALDTVDGQQFLGRYTVKLLSVKAN